MLHSHHDIVHLAKTLSIYFDDSFIHFGSIKATPALILCIVYFILLILICYHGTKNERIEITLFSWSNFSEGRKNHIIRSIGVTIIISCVCWIIPPLFNKENIIKDIFNLYLIYEPIIALVILLSLCSALLTKYNIYTHVAAINKVVEFVLPISIAIGLFERRINLNYCPNWLALSFVYIFYFLLLFNDNKIIWNQNTKKNQAKDLSYNPTENIEELFPKHRAQAERIVKIISDSSSEPLSICLSGDWGSGKTSTIQGVIKLLENEYSKKYSIIRINAMEIDNKQALINYFISEVKDCLKERGIYTGLASELKEFIVSTVSTLAKDSIGSFIQKILFSNESNYRKEKNDLENLIVNTFEEGKIILIVDDIERCQPKIAKEFLFLIKEVATMKNCVSIFVTDYNILNDLIANNDISDKNNHYYLDKFFNHRLDLCNENLEDIVCFLDKHFKEDIPEYDSIYEMILMSPGKWCKTVFDNLEVKIKKQKEYIVNQNLPKEDKIVQEEKLLNFKNNKTAFEQFINNPRMLVKFYNTFKRNIFNCYKDFSNVANKYEINKFANERNIGEIIAFLSFVEVYLPDELINIRKESAYYIEPRKYGNNLNISEKQNFLIEIASVTIYRKDSNNKDLSNYIMNEINNFINCYLEPDTILNQLLKPFSSQEEEYIDAIKSNNVKYIEENWHNMVKITITNLHNSNKDTDILMCYDYLIKHAIKKINNNQWTIDKLFTIFLYDKRGRYFSSCTEVIQIFWKHIQNLNLNTLTNENQNILTNFSKNYLYHKIDSTYKLLLCICNLDDDILKPIKDEMWNSNRTLEQNLNRFIDKITDNLPELVIDNTNAFEKYRLFTKYILNYLYKYDLLIYEDVTMNVEHMLDSIEEISCLNKILENVSKMNVIENANKVDYSKLTEAIDHFKYILNDSEKNIGLDVEKQFLDFLYYLNSSQDTKLNNTQIKQLHDLVSLIHKKTECDNTLYYRKIILNLSNKYNNIEMQ